MEHPYEVLLLLLLLLLMEPPLPLPAWPYFKKVPIPKSMSPKPKRRQLSMWCVPELALRAEEYYAADCQNRVLNFSKTQLTKYMTRTTS
jgi:hypothetical protein